MSSALISLNHENQLFSLDQTPRQLRPHCAHFAPNFYQSRHLQCEGEFSVFEASVRWVFSQVRPVHGFADVKYPNTETLKNRGKINRNRNELSTEGLLI